MVVRVALVGLCDRVVLGLVDTPNCVTKDFNCVGALLGVWGSIGCSCWALRTRVTAVFVVVCVWGCVV